MAVRWRRNNLPKCWPKSWHGAKRTNRAAKLPAGVAAAIASRRAFYEVRAAHSPETRMWRSADSTAWTVVYEADARFQASCLNRFIYVKGVSDLAEALQNADNVRGRFRPSASRLQENARKSSRRNWRAGA